MTMPKGYRLPSRLRNMTEVEAAYLGAMIDGEGCITNSGRGHRQIKFGNTDIELISACLRATGIGGIELRLPRGLSKLPLWIWNVGRAQEIEDLCRRIAPYSMKAQRELEDEK